MGGQVPVSDVGGESVGLDDPGGQFVSTVRVVVDLHGPSLGPCLLEGLEEVVVGNAEAYVDGIAYLRIDHCRELGECTTQGPQVVTGGELGDGLAGC